MTVQFFASFGFFYIGLQYLEYVAGLSPLQAACALLPLPIVLIPLARQAPVLAQRFGTNRIAGTGLLLAAAGMLLLSLGVDTDLVYWQFGTALAVFAAGMALSSTPATMAIVSSLPATKQGVGSAVNDVSREFGSALGIAILGSVLNSQYRDNLTPAVSELPPGIAEAATSSLGAVQQGCRPARRGRLPSARRGPAGLRRRHRRRLRGRSLRARDHRSHRLLASTQRPGAQRGPRRGPEAAGRGRVSQAGSVTPARLVYWCPTGITQRKALRTGPRHQHEDEHSHRRVPAASAARVPRAAPTYRPTTTMAPRLTVAPYADRVSGPHRSRWVGRVGGGLAVCCRYRVMTVEAWLSTTRTAQRWIGAMTAHTIRPRRLV